MIYALMIVMAATAATASLFFKKASGCDGVPGMLKCKDLYIGGALYVLAALFNIYILRYLDYSVVMPMGSLTYIWTMILSYTVLKEHISKKKIIGVACIIAGAVCVALA